MNDISDANYATIELTLENISDRLQDDAAALEVLNENPVAANYLEQAARSIELARAQLQAAMRIGA